MATILMIYANMKKEQERYQRRATLLIGGQKREVVLWTAEENKEQL